MMERITPPGRPPEAPPDEPTHWLVRPGTIRGIWTVFALILAGLVAGDLLVHHHEHFRLDGFFGFYAWYGFGTCVLMVLGAKFLGIFLKRPDTYYPGSEDLQEGQAPHESRDPQESRNPQESGDISTREAEGDGPGGERGGTEEE